MRFPIGSKVRIKKTNPFVYEPEGELEVVDMVWVISQKDGEPALRVLADRLEIIEPQETEEDEE